MIPDLSDKARENSEKISPNEKRNELNKNKTINILTILSQ